MEVADVRDKSLVEYLATMGLTPLRTSGRSFIYFSPWRDEVEPSFHVFKKDGGFKDFGSGESGNIIDFVKRLHNTDFKGAMKILSDGIAIDLPKFERSKKAERPGIEIISINDLNSEELLGYMESRGIPKRIAQRYCKHVYFHFPLGKIPGVVQSATGFLNDSGGFEIRDSLWKVSSAPKNIRTIHGVEGRNKIFEGFIDFLSYLVLNDIDGCEETVIVLNSLGYLTTIIPLIRDAQSNELYIDQGKAADEKIIALREAEVPYTDCREFFAPHDDVNDFLVSQK